MSDAKTITGPRRKAISAGPVIDSLFSVPLAGRPVVLGPASGAIYHLGQHAAVVADLRMFAAYRVSPPCRPQQRHRDRIVKGR
jgi:hypothetical protein